MVVLDLAPFLSKKQCVEHKDYERFALNTHEEHEKSKEVFKPKIDFDDSKIDDADYYYGNYEKEKEKAEVKKKFPEPLSTCILGEQHVYTRRKRGQVLQKSIKVPYNT